MAHVVFRLGGELHPVDAGSVVGRLASAGLRIRDPRVSEAHALVSLRGRRMRLLALRRWFEVDGERASDVVLAPGHRIRLAPEVVLDVVSVHVDTPALGIRIGEALFELEAGVYSVMPGDPPRVIEGVLVGARGAIWSTGTGWSAELDGQSVDLAPGTELVLDGVPLAVVGLPALDAHTTAGEAGHLDAPLEVVMRHDTVHLFRSGRPPLVLTGLPAKIVSECGALGAPAPWEIVAREIWRRGPSHTRRQNWDRTLRRLRGKLRHSGVRADLVRADGCGNVELYLLPGDALVDQM